ncbi:hypothetical protein Tco_1055406, partial [Tanacetum coccineum]
DLLQKFPYHGIDLWLQIQIFYDHVNPIIRRTIDQAAGGKLRDKNDKESWALLEDLTLYDNESWNDPRDFAKPVKAISMPHDVPSASDRHLIELENQVQRMMEAHISQSKPAQVNTIASSCEICSGPMTLNIAWKIPRKLLLITRLHEATEWEASRSLLIKGQEPSTKPPMIGKTNQTLVGNVPKLSRARKGARCPHTLPTRLIGHQLKQFKENDERLRLASRKMVV